MLRRSLALVGIVVLALGLFAAGRTTGFAQAAQQQEALLLIERFDFASGRILSEALEEASGWVREMRKTGEYHSVRLYMHNYGPELAVYVVAEPKSWQSVKTGADKLFAARPDILTTPFRWAGHSDNILAEIPVR
jgi:hypothetical protein